MPKHVAFFFLLCMLYTTVLNKLISEGIWTERKTQPKELKELVKGKGKGLPQQAEVAQGVSGTLRSRIFLTFGTTRVVDRQPYAPAAFTPGEIPGTHF
jgi:hypothetical protein